MNKKEGEKIGKERESREKERKKLKKRKREKEKENETKVERNSTESSFYWSSRLPLLVSLFLTRCFINIDLVYLQYLFYIIGIIYIYIHTYNEKRSDGEIVTWKKRRNTSVEEVLSSSVFGIQVC